MRSAEEIPATNAAELTIELPELSFDFINSILHLIVDGDIQFEDLKIGGHPKVAELANSILAGLPRANAE
jgi:hypothetical protein